MCGSYSTESCARQPILIVDLMQKKCTWKGSRLVSLYASVLEGLADRATGGIDPPGQPLLLPSARARRRRQRESLDGVEPPGWRRRRFLFTIAVRGDDEHGRTDRPTMMAEVSAWPGTGGGGGRAQRARGSSITMAEFCSTVTALRRPLYPLMWCSGSGPRRRQQDFFLRIAGGDAA